MPLPDLNSLPLPALYTRLESTGLICRLLELARDEDLGPGGIAADITSASMSDPTRPVRALLNARQGCTIAGLAVVPELLRVFDPAARCSFRPTCHDGEAATKGESLATLEGPLSLVLSIERTLLNLVSRLSGVATLTRVYADRMRKDAPGSPSRLYDTRKTTLGLRVLEKYAVRCGGGFSHRLGLHDAVLIKDNHIAAVPLAQLARAVGDAAAKARQASREGLRFVEVEVDSLDQFREVLTLPAGVVDIVLLDNMPPAQLREAVALRDAVRGGAGEKSVELEASGGVSLETIGAIAATGVDRISAGALTHQAVSVDLGLDIE